MVYKNALTYETHVIGHPYEGYNYRVISVLTDTGKVTGQPSSPARIKKKKKKDVLDLTCGMFGGKKSSMSIECTYLVGEKWMTFGQ